MNRREGERESDPEKRIESSIELLHRGSEDAAFRRMIEVGPEAIPILWRAFGVEAVPKARAVLLEAIRVHRVEASIPLLERALDDPSPEVWKAALDGLVSIGGGGALDALERQKERAAPGGDRREWIEEAIGQVGEKIEPRAAREDGDADEAIDDPDLPALPAEMECPRCGEPMAGGRIVIQGTILGSLMFGLSYQHAWFQPDDGSEKEIAVNNSDRPRAFRCPHCRVLVVGGDDDRGN